MWPVSRFQSEPTDTECPDFGIVYKKWKAIEARRKALESDQGKQAEEEVKGSLKRKLKEQLKRKKGVMMGAISKERIMSVRRKAVVFILQVPGVLGAIWACFAMVDQFVFHITGHEVKLFNNSFYSFAALLAAFLVGITGLLDYLSREQ